MPTGHYLKPEEKLSVLEDLMAAQDSQQGIAAKHKLALTTVVRLAHKLASRKNGTTLRELAGVEAGETSVSSKTKPGRKTGSKYTHLYKKMDKLKASGWTVNEIANHLKIKRSAVNYYLYYTRLDHKSPSRKPLARSKKHKTPNTEVFRPLPSTAPDLLSLAKIDHQIKKLMLFRAALVDYLES